LEELEARIQQRGGRILVTRVDVRDVDQVNSWIKKTVDAFGKLDGAANIAGVSGKQSNRASIEDIDEDDWSFVLDVNLSGVMHCMRAQATNMNGKGSIVNAASVAGIIGLPKSGAYVAAKHGVIGLTKTAARDLGTKGIRVNCFAP
jgi:NAD(P)-dependent dehydrogenase (short-subunit alcohol dehydrogenase family)